MSPLSIGTWVHASDSVVFDLTRRAAVGMYIGWKHFEDREKILYLIGHNEERPMGYYEHIRPITKAEGKEIVKAWNEARYERMYRNTPIPDQIRAFLREEAARRRGATCEQTLICPDAGESDCSEAQPENMLAT